MKRSKGHCGITSILLYSIGAIRNILLMRVLAKNVLAYELKLDFSGFGGLSHSSTYGCQNSGPFARERIVCS
jgi:hypothetical protein